MVDIDAEALTRTFHRAVAHHRAGELAEAERLYREILAVRIEPHTLNLLGLIARSAHQYEAALALIAQAIELKPEVAEFHNNVGNVLRDLGRGEAAVEAFERAVALDPGTVAIRVNYAAALLDAKRVAESRALLEAAALEAPRSFEAQFCLGLARRADKDYISAAEALRRATDIDPQRPDAWYNLGNALHLAENDVAAVPCFEQAMALKPDYAEAYCNMGMTRRNSLEAIGWYESAIALKPGLAIAHSNLAHTLLLRGQYERGFREYEWRWQHPETPARPFAQAEWQGEEMGDRRLLVHAEQGFGDTLQFVRYMSLVRERAPRILFECQPELKDLLRCVAGIEELVARGETVTDFDRQVPLLSLPRIFGTTLATVPAEVPYLAPDPERVARWRERLAAPAGAARIGLVWAGNPLHKNDHNRSIRLAELAPLLATEGASFFGVQKGPAAAEAAELPPGARLVSLSDNIHDFADTAAILSQLDLLIAVDTSVVHLAGALALPVWTMLPIAPDWRWQLECTDSPWYPTLRLFRQATPKARPALIDEVTRAFRHWLQERA